MAALRLLDGVHGQRADGIGHAAQQGIAGLGKGRCGGEGRG
jgi:hypothetical protein